MNMAKWKFTGAVKEKSEEAIYTMGRNETVREFAKRSGISVSTAYRVWHWCRQFAGEHVLIRHDVMMFGKVYSND